MARGSRTHTSRAVRERAGARGHTFQRLAGGHMSSSALSTDHETCFDLGPLDRIPLGEGRTFNLGGREVAVFRTRMGVFATDAMCPHKTGRLADGLVGDGKVICPLHGFKFA